MILDWIGGTSDNQKDDWGEYEGTRAGVARGGEPERTIQRPMVLPAISKITTECDRRD